MNDFLELKQQIINWATFLGFADLKVTDIDPGHHVDYLQNWLGKNYHGDMAYMQNHADIRKNPTKILPGAKSIISVRMNYFPEDDSLQAVLNDPKKAYISRYALGRDYHKLMRKRLEKLGKKIAEQVEKFGYRVCVDSVPVLEKAFAEKAGLGWIGKNTLLLNRQAGSYFFLGEILIDFELPSDKPNQSGHCGTCHACIDLCPTKAIIAPYQLDARRCISYLTIENKGSIPIEFRELMGNRIFGCDDCQLVCPWNRFASLTQEIDFAPRHGLDQASLLSLFDWSESEFLEKTVGSPIRRAGYLGWIRNIVIALGNAPFDKEIIRVIEKKRESISKDWLLEHFDWAINLQKEKLARNNVD